MKNKKKIYTLGPKGSFHHLSCVEYLGGQQEIEFCESFAGIYEAVQAGHLGWIALYNTLAGVVENHENEINKNFTLLDEMEYEVKLCVCSKPQIKLKDIVKLYSHEKAFGESKRFIAENFPNATLITCSSTSHAADKVSKENELKAGAICHAETASFYGLSIVSSIPNKRKNLTSFGLFAG
ncbi:prephenate dehydratase domain-containing protein [Marivirga harenae]|uniref:prephenate dehydratase domain-containing protein n=1 Tax=Marivirga harenae TaxID=2010992 RepID=UPI0026DFE974|nr:prephenate dehydratase domain-containing protein [Marivirga harenae]WKV12381.1 prephenate dehydratase domain-containing protein [Marivirga harenae]|tara:strand:+ start:18555 stop:19097 length:543 start_codon:yes stop_codon:yes gene_type:complete